MRRFKVVQRTARHEILLVLIDYFYSKLYFFSIREHIEFSQLVHQAVIKHKLNPKPGEFHICTDDEKKRILKEQSVTHESLFPHLNLYHDTFAKYYQLPVNSLIEVW
jgi:hypothetical protein